MNEFFLISGIVIACFGLTCLVFPTAVTGAPGRRRGLFVFMAGALVAVGSTFPAPNAEAAATVRDRLMVALDAGQPDRHEVVERWAAARAALPGGSVPDRFLRWNTTDPIFGTNLNLIPAAAYTQGLTPQKITASATIVPLDRVRENPTRHVGTILKYSGTVLYVASLPLDSTISQVLQRSDTSFTVVWIKVGDQQQLQFMTFDGPTDLSVGDSVTVYGYLLGIVSPESKTPVLFGKVLERQ